MGGYKPIHTTFWRGVKKKKHFKTVLMPIEVPVGDYCWNAQSDEYGCHHFSNDGGWARCELSLGRLDNDTPHGIYKKPTGCLALKNYEELKRYKG